MPWDPALLPPAHRRLYRSLSTPEKIQDFLDYGLRYNKAPMTCYSPALVIEHRAAHCMEGALFAAAALRMLGHEPMLVDLEAVRDDDHVLAVFRENGCWGAIAKSNYAGIRYRSPVYRTVRELAMSYFDHYYNLKGEKSLRGYSDAVRLRRFDRTLDWMVTREEVWEIPTHLTSVRHWPVLPKGPGERRRYRMDARLYAAGCVGMEE